MELYISSGRHVFSGAESRIEEIERELGTVDVVFVEDRDKKPEPFIRLRNWVSSPLILTFIVIWLRVVSFLANIFSSDGEIAEYFCEEHSAQKYSIDKPIHEIIAREWVFWGVANWVLLGLILIGVFAFESPEIAVFSIVVLVFYFLALGVAFLAGTMSERNLHMLREMDRLAVEEDVERACLITGGAHESGIRDYAVVFDQISIINHTKR